MHSSADGQSGITTPQHIFSTGPCATPSATTSIKKDHWSPRPSSASTFRTSSKSPYLNSLTLRNPTTSGLRGMKKSTRRILDCRTGTKSTGFVRCLVKHILIRSGLSQSEGLWRKSCRTQRTRSGEARVSSFVVERELHPSHVHSGQLMGSLDTSTRPETSNLSSSPRNQVSPRAFAGLSP